MFTFTRIIQPRALVFEQAPIVGVAFVVAELFYKFHSFTLECIAFLATWYVLDAIRQLLKDRFAAQ